MGGRRVSSRKLSNELFIIRAPTHNITRYRPRANSINAHAPEHTHTHTCTRIGIYFILRGYIAIPAGRIILPIIAQTNLRGGGAPLRAYIGIRLTSASAWRLDNRSAGYSSSGSFICIVCRNVSASLGYGE